MRLKTLSQNGPLCADTFAHIPDFPVSRHGSGQGLAASYTRKYTPAGALRDPKTGFWRRLRLRLLKKLLVSGIDHIYAHLRTFSHFLHFYAKAPLLGGESRK